MEAAMLIGILGIAVVVLVNALAPRVGVAAPLLLVALGIAISFLPFVEAIEIEPEWILGGILPPLLYAAAVNVPVMEFRRDFQLISGFSVLLVVVSSVVVGVLMSWLIPGLPLPLGIAVGAIVSPTDAVATSIVKRAGISTRVVTVLEGESLLNDASALVLLRSAVAALAATVSVWEVGANFLYAVALAVAIGLGVGKLNVAVSRRLTSATSIVAVSFIVPFAAYLPAEQLGASGLVASVTAGLVTGFGAPRALSPETRLTSDAVWRTIELLLESAIFLVMGLELFGLVEDVLDGHDSIGVALGLGAVAATAVIIVRAVFVASSLALLARRERRAAGGRERRGQMQERLANGEPAFDDARAEEFRKRLEADPRRAARHAEQVERMKADPERAARRVGQLQRLIDRRIADIDYLAAEHFGWREGMLLVWAGMRGAVTLAAAQSLPVDVPHRSLLILIAFVVAAGTLIIQGGTLSPLARRLGLDGRGGADDREQRIALQTEIHQAALDRLADPALVRADGSPYSTVVVDGVRKAMMMAAPVADPEDEGTLDQQAETLSLRLDLIEAERRALLDLREVGTYPSALLDDLLRRLDADQLGLKLRRID